MGGHIYEKSGEKGSNAEPGKRQKPRAEESDARGAGRKGEREALAAGGAGTG